MTAYEWNSKIKNDGGDNVTLNGGSAVTIDKDATGTGIKIPRATGG